jgi:GalNAc-alpha-(1->4)-GalNAc-alpha-(1->3)-diNAcBac-PP-undecaprenol alpha-1,4-N-acetyl-D-galactosaminyltransferase
MTANNLETQPDLTPVSPAPSPPRTPEPVVARQPSVRRRITFVISSLRAGGAERVLSRMANYWAERDWPVTLVTLEPTARDFYPVHPAVERVELNASGVSTTLWRALWSNWTRIRRIGSAIRASRPEVVISFMVPTTVITLLAARRAHVPVVVSERTDPSRAPLARVWATLRRITYPWAAAVVVQTPEVELWAESFLRKDRVHVIPNPVVAPPARSNEQATDAAPVDVAIDRSARHVLAIGRMDTNKAFDLLIRAFAQCHAGRPNWQLTILGEGEERRRLEALTAELGIVSHVHLPGTVSDPTPTLRGADVFVLASRYEGFPNALLEAMAAGLPVVATASRGSSRIVRDDVDGILVPIDDVPALAAAIAALMDDEPRRLRLGRRAMEVTERFNVEQIMSAWESVIDGTLAHHAAAARGSRA